MKCVVLPKAPDLTFSIKKRQIYRQCTQKSHRFALKRWLLVRQKGFEPPTFWFVAKHSIQLSYWRIPQPFRDCPFRIPNPSRFVKNLF